MLILDKCSKYDYTSNRKIIASFFQQMSRVRAFLTRLHVRPARSQIIASFFQQMSRTRAFLTRLHVRSARSQITASFFQQMSRAESISYKIACASCEESDHLALSRSLIRVFAGTQRVANWPEAHSSRQWCLWSDCESWSEFKCFLY